MIKKFIILFLIVLLFTLSFLFFKKDDKYKLPAQYKVEIQKVIDEEVPKTKICVDKNFLKAQNEYSKIKNHIKNEYIEESVFIIEDSQRGIEVCEFNMISKLLDITQKYTDIKKEIPPTDFSGTLNDFIYPYFERNNINYKKLIEIGEYSIYKINEIDNFSYIKLSEDDIYNPNN